MFMRRILSSIKPSSINRRCLGPESKQSSRACESRGSAGSLLLNAALPLWCTLADAAKFKLPLCVCYQSQVLIH